MLLETSWDALWVLDYLDCSEGLAAEQQVQTDVFDPIMELQWRLARSGTPSPTATGT